MIFHRSIIKTYLEAKGCIYFLKNCRVVVGEGGGLTNMYLLPPSLKKITISRSNHSPGPRVWSNQPFPEKIPTKAAALSLLMISLCFLTKLAP